MTDARRQLRSGTVVLGSVGVLAVALTACSSEPDKRCVDRDSYSSAKGYRVVADKNCSSSSGPGTWYYGGKKKSGYVDSGSFTKSGSGSGSSGGKKGGGGVERGGIGGKGGSGG